MDKPRLAIATDFRSSTDDPRPSLEGIAAAGFTHVNWCHEWNTARLYSRAKMATVVATLREFGLTMLDLHASNGSGLSWASDDGGARIRGLALLKNRIELAVMAACPTVVIHLPVLKDAPPARCELRARTIESLRELEPVCRGYGIRLAIENLADDDFATIRAVLSEFGGDYVGLCYDSGHANIGGRGIGHLESLGVRLLAIHLHDNDGSRDSHRLPFTGTVDWPRLVAALARSAYTGPVSLELNFDPAVGTDERAFLAAAFRSGEKLRRMLAERTTGFPAP